MQLTTFLWLGVALGAAAHPSAHAHSHLHRHNHRDLHNHRPGHAALAQRGRPVFFRPTHTRPKPPATTAPPPPPPPPPATTAPPAPAQTNNTPPPASNNPAPFCGGRKRATEAQIAYKGNTGNGQWGCNMMLVDSNVANSYKYTSVYTNAGSEKHSVHCFNKIGPAGLINGFFGFSAVSFELGPGQSQTVAFDSNTQGACAFHPSSVPKTNWGEWAGTWVEFDFENSSNKGFSGADCSSLVAQSADMDVPGCQVCQGSTCSTIWPGGHGDNAYIKGTEAADGIGLNLAPGTVRLQVKVGFTG